MFDTTPILQKVFGKEYRFDIPAGPALVYLYRRFGPPQHGSDDFKQTCRYVLPTVMKGVYVDVNIKGEDASFIPHVTKEAYEEGGGNICIQDVQAAYEAVLRDLCRLVYVRDVAINILGVVDEDDAWDMEQVEPFHAAGWGVDHRIFQNPELFGKFLDFVEAQGGGAQPDLTAGMQAIMDRLGRECEAEAGNE